MQFLLSIRSHGHIMKFFVGVGGGLYRLLFCGKVERVIRIM